MSPSVGAHRLTAVATSRTFQQPARLCGAAPGRRGPFVERVLRRRKLRRAIDRPAALPADRHRRRRPPDRTVWRRAAGVAAGRSAPAPEAWQRPRRPARG